MYRLFFTSLFFLGMLFVFIPVSNVSAAECTSVAGQTCRPVDCLGAEVLKPGFSCSISTPGGVSGGVCCGSSSIPSGSVGPCPTDFTRQAGVCFPNASKIGLGDMSVFDLLQRVMNWLLGIVGVLAVIAFIISGVQYLVSAGDEKLAETAKRNMKYAIIGLVVALSGLIIVNAVAGLTGAAGVTNF